MDQSIDDAFIGQVELLLALSQSPVEVSCKENCYFNTLEGPNAKS